MSLYDSNNQDINVPSSPLRVQRTVLTPKNIFGANLVLWVRSDLGITLNGSHVSAWADQSGNGNNLSQGTAAQQPAFTASDPAFNGHPSLGFLTANSSNMVAAAFGSALAQPDTMYFVCKIDGSAAVERISDGSVHRQIAYNPASSTEIGATTSPFTNSIQTTGANCSIPCIIQVDWNGASSAIYDSSVTANITGNAGADSLDQYILSDILGVTGISGTVVEALLISANPSAAQRRALLNYAGSRYGIAVS